MECPKCKKEELGRADVCCKCGSVFWDEDRDPLPSAGLDGSKAARIEKDRAIIQLWNAMRDLSDFGEEALTEQDLTLWGYVIGHDAVQSRLVKP